MAENMELKSTSSMQFSFEKKKEIRFENLERRDLNQDVLVRFFDKLEHANDFLNKGSLKWNTLKHVRLLNKERKDNEDSVLKDFLLDYSACSDDKKYFLCPTSVFGNERHYNDMSVRYTDIFPHADQTLIYCMSFLKVRNSRATTTFKESLLQDIKNTLKHEDTERYAVVIHDQSDFLSRLKTACTHKFQSFIRIKKVEYYEYDPYEFINEVINDELFVGTHKNLFFEKAVFSKDVKFMNENEIRFSVKNTKLIEKYSIVDIGNNNNCAFLIDLKNKNY